MTAVRSDNRSEAEVLAWIASPGFDVASASWLANRTDDELAGVIERCRAAGAPLDGMATVAEFRSKIAAAQADARRAANDARVAELEPESVTDVWRGRLAAQVARRARDRGQLDLSGQ